MQFDSRMTKAVDFVYWLLVKGKNDDLRGPHLARLEIERTKLEYGKGDANKFAAGIASYFCRLVLILWTIMEHFKFQNPRL